MIKYREKDNKEGENMESIFFDSQVTYDEHGNPIYDRPNSAEQIRKTFSSLISNGVVSTVHNNMAAEVGFIVHASSGMTITVNNGICWINGSCGFEEKNREFTLDIGTDQPRIDSVVLRWDNRMAARDIDIFIKKGTPGVDPTVPTLQRDYTVYELRLANILVPANTSTIVGGNIEDTRLNTEECGIVVCLVKGIDTSELYNQIQSDLNSFKQNEEADFLEWFESIQNILDENVAANLQKQIDEKVPLSRVINGKTLTDDITLTIEDIGTSAVFLASHPVGSLFETTVSTNPGTLYGGTWAAWGGGRVPVGVNTADSDFNTVEKTGGKKTERHEFKVGYKGYFGATVGDDENMVQAYRYSTSSYGTYAYEGSTQAGVNAGIQASTNTRDVAQASSTGDTSETSIVQPYITCYIWKRTT